MRRDAKAYNVAAMNRINEWTDWSRDDYLAAGTTYTSVKVGWHGNGYQTVNFVAYFETEAEVDAYIAQFPKSLRLKSSVLFGSYDYEHGWKLYTARLDLSWRTNGATGERNEASDKRLRSMMRNLDKLGIVPVQRLDRVINDQPTLAEILA